MSRDGGANSDSGLMIGSPISLAKLKSEDFPASGSAIPLGRGRPTLDFRQVLTALPVATRRIELGIAVLQLPLRNPIELADRVQSL
jgi:alkanesulfonate monooxygenase SsuD/methylene tetrahydromethanopterin reductase-like flavin-dependent oxidoreductase (luciferase family)